MLRPLLALFVFCALLLAEPPALAPNAIVENYSAVSRDRQNALYGCSMDVEIEARLPKLKKQGRLHGLRRISALGRITYDKLRFEGDGAIKNNVIARYLTAEAQAADEQNSSLAVTSANYRFRYKGTTVSDGRRAHIFQVSPRKKRLGLFKGELWIDAATYLTVQESGTLVKNPSIFLRKVEFVRKYEIRDGLSLPREIASVVDTRLVGKAELKIDFTNFSLQETGGQ